MGNLETLERIASELIKTYGITEPPVPVESMLKNPKGDMWDEVDVNQLSGSFLVIKDRFSPRMSMARLLVRHIAISEWGRERGLQTIFIQDEALIKTFGRMIVMPKELLSSLSNSARTAPMISLRFEVPEEDARLRLLELAEI